MTRERAIECARRRLQLDGVRLKQLEPSRVEEHAKMVSGARERGWRIVYVVDYPEWPEYTFIVVEVREPSGEVVVLPAL